MGVLFTVAGIIAVVVVVALGAGFVSGVSHAAGWGKSNRKPLKGTQQKSLPYAHFDVDSDISPKDVTKVVERYVGDEVLDLRAQATLGTLREADVRRQSVAAVLKEEFGEGSLTWEKYNAPIQIAFDGITRNAARIANNMQTFDTKEYARMNRIDQASGYSDDSNEVARLALMRNQLADMDDLQDKNDTLLVELETLEQKIAKLTGTDDESMIEDLRQLAEDTKYYA